MNRWFTKLAMVLLPSCVLSFAPANANAAYDGYMDPSCDPCNPCADWCSGFTFGADFIWWKPCIDDLDYAFQTDAAFTSVTGTVTGHYKHVDPKWEPGVRGYIAIDDIFYGMDLLGSYTWLNVNRRNGVAGAVASTLYSTQFNPNVSNGVSFSDLASKYRLNYQTFDVLLASECCVCDHIFKPYFGIAGVFLDQKIHTEGTVSGGTVRDRLRWHSDYWGIGFRVGSEYRYNFCDGFGFFACASGAIVAGESDTNRGEIRDVNGTPAILNQHKDDNCHFLNGYHIAAGFDYEDCWCNWDFALRLGYEFCKWHNVPGLRRFQGTTAALAATSSSPFTTTLGFHGLFVGLNVSF